MCSIVPNVVFFDNLVKRIEVFFTTIDTIGHNRLFSGNAKFILSNC